VAIFKETEIPYRVDRNPGNTKPEELLINPEMGGNCELLAQAVVIARGFRIPQLRSSELYKDAEFSKPVRDISQAETGDIIGLRPFGKKGFRGVHIGIILIGEDGEVHIAHNARHVGQAKLEPLGEAMKYPQHETIAWIKRPIVEDSSLRQPEKLAKLGLGDLIREL
jgi:hypothetical protein